MWISGSIDCFVFQVGHPRIQVHPESDDVGIAASTSSSIPSRFPGDASLDFFFNVGDGVVGGADHFFDSSPATASPGCVLVPPHPLHVQ